MISFFIIASPREVDGRAATAPKDPHNLASAKAREKSFNDKSAKLVRRGHAA
jgi:hypothetical protein